MANSRTVAGLVRVYQRLAARGFPVEQYPGWQRRGRGAYVPRGHVEHCTSDARPLPRDRMLQLLANGHGNLQNAVCTWAVARENPAAVLIAAEVAWHAGQGGWQGLAGNSSVSGSEIQRATGQAITTRQLEIARAISQEMTAEFDVPVLRVCTHNEWTPRKLDPVGIDGWAWRAGLEATTEEDHDVIRFDDRGGHVARLQQALNRWQQIHGQGGGSPLQVDGHYGPATRGRVRTVCQRIGFPVVEDGEVATAYFLDALHRDTDHHG